MTDIDTPSRFRDDTRDEKDPTSIGEPQSTPIKSKEHLLHAMDQINSKRGAHDIIRRLQATNTASWTDPEYAGGGKY